jgi:transcription initiation factor IIE alpha subunit
MIKTEIGINAGRIWQFLDQKGESSISEIEKALSMKSSDVRMALGWLARENKIFFFEEGDDLWAVLLY